MGLFDQIVEQISEPQQSGTEASSPGLAGSLMSLLGGEGESGGLASLVGRFKAAGLGHIVESWMSDRPNQPVDPNQLRDVLGEEQTQQMAAQSGLSVETLLSQLASHLPGLIDRMTADGAVPPSQDSGSGTTQT